MNEIDAAFRAQPAAVPQDTEQLLDGAIHKLRAVGNEADPTDLADWQRYLHAAKALSLANWKATTELSARFSIIKSVINEIK